MTNPKSKFLSLTAVLLFVASGLLAHETPGASGAAKKGNEESFLPVATVTLRSGQKYDLADFSFRDFVDPYPGKFVLNPGQAKYEEIPLWIMSDELWMSVTLDSIYSIELSRPPKVHHGGTFWYNDPDYWRDATIVLKTPNRSVVSGRFPRYTKLLWFEHAGWIKFAGKTKVLGETADFSIECDKVRKIERREGQGDETPTFVVTQWDGDTTAVTSLKLLHGWNRRSEYSKQIGLRVKVGAAEAELELKKILRVSLFEKEYNRAYVTMRDGEKSSCEIVSGYNKVYGRTRDGRVLFTFIQKIKEIEFVGE